MMARQERDQVAEALQVAERRYAATVARHGQLLAEQAGLEVQLSRFLRDLDNLPAAMRPLLARHTQLRGHNSEVGEVQHVGAEASRFAGIVARGRAILAHLDAELVEQDGAAV